MISILQLCQQASVTCGNLSLPRCVLPPRIDDIDLLADGNASILITRSKQIKPAVAGLDMPAEIYLIPNREPCDAGLGSQSGSVLAENECPVSGATSTDRCNISSFCRRAAAYRKNAVPPRWYAYSLHSVNSIWKDSRQVIQI